MECAPSLTAGHLYHHHIHTTQLTVKRRRALTNTAGGGCPPPVTPAPTPGGPQSILFSTPGAATWTVPAGVTSIKISAIGGGGGGGYSAPAVGGNGAIVNATLTVTPGATLNMFVGGGGEGECMCKKMGGGKPQDAWEIVVRTHINSFLFLKAMASRLEQGAAARTSTLARRTRCVGLPASSAGLNRPKTNPPTPRVHGKTQ